MRYFYQEPGGARVGPYTRDELRQLHLSGLVKPDTLVVREGAEASVVFSELWAEWQNPQQQPGKAYETFAARTGEDLRSLAPHLLLPFREARDFDWLKNRKLIAIAAVGLVPLLINATTSHLGAAFWGMALYFSALWALFFYHVFPTPEARVSTSALCFFFDGRIVDQRAVDGVSASALDVGGAVVQIAEPVQSHARIPKIPLHLVVDPFVNAKPQA